MMTEGQQRGAELYRLAVANKVIRLGLVRRNDQGEMEATPAMVEMDMPIEPDEIDYGVVRRQQLRDAWRFGRRR